MRKSHLQNTSEKNHNDFYTFRIKFYGYFRMKKISLFLNFANRKMLSKLFDGI